jgi:MFS family permease|tara:strand:- start:156 stop:773 length:618 start_codon:yes stop_codon:yes gene_type:complete
MNTYHKDALDTTENDNGADDGKENVNLCYAYTCLFLQSLVLISFNWSRNLISEAYGFSGDHDGELTYDIRRDVTKLNDDNIGTLIGFWNTVTFAPATIIAGGICDKVNRKNMIFITGFLGGIATCLNYYAGKNDGVQIDGIYILQAMRALNGLFCAFCQPATYSLINDMFPKSSRTKAFFLYQIFGTLADCLKQMSVVVIDQVGW